jgi:hypothetical protein
VQPAVPTIDLTAERPWWAWWGPPALLLAAFVLFYVRRRLRGVDTEVRDSDAFKAEIKRWYPLIYAANPTPRAIKRFQNRMRFLAMQARPHERSSSRIDRAIDWLEQGISGVSGWIGRAILRRKSQPEPAEGVSGDGVRNDGGFEIEPAMLVSLGTVDTLSDGALDGNMSERLHGIVLAKIEEVERRLADGLRTEAYKERLGELRQLVSGGKWQPGPQDLSDYRALNGRA